MNKFLLIGIFLLSFSIPSYAQFIGIRIGIPMLSPQGNTTGATVNSGGGPVIPNNAMTFNGAYMLFNGSYMTFSGTP